MKKSKLKKIINEVLNEERKSKKDKVKEKWRINVKMKDGGRVIRSKWYKDWDEAYDEFPKFITNLAKKYDAWDGQRITEPNPFDFRYIESNKGNI